jgi:hypothetical protein
MSLAGFGVGSSAQYYHKKLIIVVLLLYVFMRLILSNDDRDEDAPAFGKSSNLLLGICLAINHERRGEESRDRNRLPRAGLSTRPEAKGQAPPKDARHNTQPFHGKFEHRATSSVANAATLYADQGQVRPALRDEPRSGRRIMQRSQF